MYPLMGWIHQIRIGLNILYVLFILFLDTHWICIHDVSDMYLYPIRIHRVLVSLTAYRCFVGQHPANMICHVILYNNKILK
jgi:hypothetical protein